MCFIQLVFLLSEASYIRRSLFVIFVLWLWLALLKIHISFTGFIPVCSHRSDSQGHTIAGNALVGLDLVHPLTLTGTNPIEVLTETLEMTTTASVRTALAAEDRHHLFKQALIATFLVMSPLPLHQTRYRIQ
jgi:hypothetical protein